MYMNIHIYIYVYIYVHTNIYIYMYIRTYAASSFVLENCCVTYIWKLNQKYSIYMQPVIYTMVASGTQLPQAQHVCLASKHCAFDQEWNHQCQHCNYFALRAQRQTLSKWHPLQQEQIVQVGDDCSDYINAFAGGLAIVLGASLHHLLILSEFDSCERGAPERRNSETNYSASVIHKG